MKVLASLISFSLVFVQPASVSNTSYSNQSVSDEVPHDLKECFNNIGEEFNICPEFMEAIAFYESRFDEKAKNGNCYGLMQINIRVHAKRMKKYGFTKKDMFEPYKNITVAADYLSELYEIYEDTGTVILLYTGNTKDIKQYLKTGKLPKSVQRILDKSYELERIHDK